MLEPRVFADARGFFLASWNDEAFRLQVADTGFVQDNQSRSLRGTIRGLHFQLRHTQGKLVRCSSGRIWDVVVDVRRSSPTFGQSLGLELSGEDHRQLWIPAGYAHGYLVLSETADLQYKVTDRYDQTSERTLLWNDPALGIDWPLPPGMAPILSAKDLMGVRLAELETLP
ncbi:MAG: dTDP-4-dehydrorhamnose 3,5-epimerase [Gemmatimonadaceae bacterium]|nr:dTDP-4-dehydrorhamnose 3,5-epimerase [Gemmatimonadaceae bacterium]